MIALDLLEGEDLVDAVATEVMGWSKCAGEWEGQLHSISVASWNPIDCHDDKISILHQILFLGATEGFIKQWSDLTDQQFGVIELMMCDPETVCLAAVATVRAIQKLEEQK